MIIREIQQKDNAQIAKVIRDIFHELDAPKVGTAYADPILDTLFEVYQAGEVVQDGELFNIHDKSNSDCPVGVKIQGILEIFLLKAQTAMEEVLKSVTIKDVLTML